MEMLGVKDEAATGADGVVGSDRLLALGAVGLELGPALGTAGGIGHQRGATLGAELLPTRLALIIANLDHLPAG
jgi:hypothetical protein